MRLRPTWLHSGRSAFDLAQTAKHQLFGDEIHILAKYILNNPTNVVCVIGVILSEVAVRYMQKTTGRRTHRERVRERGGREGKGGRGEGQGGGGPTLTD